VRNLRIKTLSTYSDWLDKAKYEFDLFTKSYGVYDLTNCLLTLNAIPEWIFNSKSSPENLSLMAHEKYLLMQGNNNFVLNTSKLSEIDHQLRLVRMFCNHAKHNKSDKEKDENNMVSIDQCFVFPATFPIKFDRIKIGDENFLAEPILESIINFWSHEVSVS